MKPIFLLVYNRSTKIWWSWWSTMVHPAKQSCQAMLLRSLLFFAHPKLHFRFFEKLRVMPASAKFCAHLSNKNLWWSSRLTTAGTKLYKHSKCRAVFCARNLWKLRRSWETVWVVDLENRNVSGVRQGNSKQVEFPHRSQHTGNWTLEVKHWWKTQRPPHYVNDLSTRCHPHWLFPQTAPTMCSGRVQ